MGEKKRKHHNDAIKQRVVDYYGKGSGCCYPECDETDLDCLVIDHVNGRSLRDMHVKTGLDFYRWLIKNDFPRSYQVLCWNHNAKKEAICRRTGIRRGALDWKWSRYK